MFFAAQEPLAAKLQFIEEIPLLMMSMTCTTIQKHFMLTMIL